MLREFKHELVDLEHDCKKRSELPGLALAQLDSRLERLEERHADLDSHNTEHFALVERLAELEETVATYHKGE